MKILLIIPAHNEEENLPHLLEEVRHEGYDAVIVDDASSDATKQVAKIAGFPLLSLTVNLGVGGCVQTGFMYAMRNGYDIVVQVDGDGQHVPEQVHRIIDPIIAGEADCVIGSRFIPETPYTEYKKSFARRVGSYFSTGLLYLATGLRIHDTTSGFRALNRSAFSFFATKYPVDHPEAESLFLLHQAGFCIQEIPVRMRSRIGGESLFTFFKSILYPLRVIIGFMGIIFKDSRRNNI